MSQKTQNKTGRRLTPPATPPTNITEDANLAALDAPKQTPPATPPADGNLNDGDAGSPAAELAKLREELAAKEAELKAREKSLAQEGEALKEMRANIDASLAKRPAPDTGVGVMLADVDLSKAPEEVRRGLHPKATGDDKKAYSKWIREHYKGKTPLKTFDVVIKKAKSADIPIRGIKAVDEGDASRRAFQRASLAGKTEGYWTNVTAVG
ncbi:hypothetical protein [Blastopirellula retiformator]|uniref:Uncharacterized protein n=1 Tax=Blastopirellula retiformator TaxID=2527970 RepID=A0A5C5UYZ6_9BACT|nr:hypothetical protein [Blastopirellula retiformator]TWT30712.1 hypothetical protein Enr8_42350 [Blastopirellula retiformator]